MHPLGYYAEYDIWENGLFKRLYEIFEGDKKIELDE